MLGDRSDHGIGDTARDADGRCRVDGHASRDDGAADGDGNGRFDTHGITHSVRVSAATAGASASPSAPATPTATPSLPPGASLPAMPAQPALPAGVTVLSSGTVAFAVSAGQTRTFEAADLMTARGATPPPSAQLVWTVAWRATDPLAAAWYRQTSRTELGRGRWGTAQLGGAGFELRNDGATNIVGELSYTVGSR